MRVGRSDERRPLLRGYFRAAAALAAVVGCVVLVLLADTPRAYVGGAIFAASLIALYTISGTYHTITWGRRAHAVLKRLDNAMIFVLIAGTYTPFCLLAASDAWASAYSPPSGRSPVWGSRSGSCGQARHAGSASGSTWRPAGSRSWRRLS